MMQVEVSLGREEERASGWKLVGVEGAKDGLCEGVGHYRHIGDEDTNVCIMETLHGAHQAEGGLGEHGRRVGGMGG